MFHTCMNWTIYSYEAISQKIVYSLKTYTSSHLCGLLFITSELLGNHVHVQHGRTEIP